MSYIVLSDADSLFGNEWMTSKIDFAGLPEFYDNFNVVDENTAFQSPSILAALFSDKSNVEKIATPEPDIVEKSVSDECHPVSPEHCVPDLEATIEEDQFKAMLDSYLANAKLSAAVEDSPLDNPAENDDVFVVEETSAPVVSLKRKLSVSTPEGPKPKVKTPEQKQRKRLQNRNAATRYRSKKRSEQEVLNAKCLDLEKENLELQQKIKNKQQEVQYLKDLIIDVFCKKHTSI